MKKLFKFLSTHKHALIWTIFYIFIMWFVLYFMFNFNIFNNNQWYKLAHAELHGFAGFVFGLLILAALPLYIATTTLIIRTKKPLITLPTPKIIPTKLLSKPQTIVPVATPEETKTEAPPQETLPDELPPELHSIFIRARNRINMYELNTQSTLTNDDEINTTQNNTFPLPTDFDIQLDAIPGMDDTPNFNTPVFTDINFDDTDTKTEIKADTNKATNNNEKITNYLAQQNISFSVTDNIITTKTHAIITHSDPDFWVIDEENWFANGKICPSPIYKIQEFALEKNLTPVIYLETTNIMDLDAHIKSWESNGIIVITTPEEL